MTIDRESGDVYDADYFLHGKQTGKSLYENYRYLPDLTIPMVKSIVAHCGITKSTRILDFGCARGYVVKALRELGYEAWGVDISQWAIANADPEVKKYCYVTGDMTLEGMDIDWIIAKDVLEHVPSVCMMVDTLMNTANEGMFVVVPLSKFDRGNYVIEEYEKDVTHIQRFKLSTWVEMFLRPEWSVEASYRVPGVKCNYKQYPKGNGFITCKRIKE